MTVEASIPRSALFSAVPSREEIRAEDYLPLVQHLVREISSRLPAHTCRDDLVSAGHFALAKVIDTYDPATGVPFQAYATQRIRGAILDELRTIDWATRTVRGRIRAIEECRDALTAETGRTPTAEEIAERLGITIDDFHRTTHDEHRSRTNSLEHLQETTGFDAVADLHSPEEETLRQEQIRYLYAAIECLPERSKHVILAYYFDGKTYSEIAEDLGVHMTRVRQIVQETLPKMQDAIAHAVSDFSARSSAPEAEESPLLARRRAEYAAEVQHTAQSAKVLDLRPKLLRAYGA